jgi:hypothetical protein
MGKSIAEILRELIERLDGHWPTTDIKPAMLELADRLEREEEQQVENYLDGCAAGLKAAAAKLREMYEDAPLLNLNAGADAIDAMAAGHPGES